MCTNLAMGITWSQQQLDIEIKWISPKRYRGTQKKLLTPMDKANNCNSVTKLNNMDISLSLFIYSHVRSSYVLNYFGLGTGQAVDEGLLAL